METEFLTPIQLWQDFNPVKDPLDISFVKLEKYDDYEKKGLYYTSENTSDGKARIYAEVVSLNDNKKKPVILVIGDIENNIDSRLLEFVANCGYIAVSFDYSAISTNKPHYTKYPESLSYAEYRLAKDNLDRVEPSAKESCWYVWAKAARRLISVISEDSKADIKNIGVLGIKQGALIMWQLAAMDGRINAAASVIGSEGMLYSHKLKYLNQNELELDESRINWRAAISAEAYARFIACPMLIVSATNNPVSSYDRVEDIVKLFPDNVQYSLITCERLRQQITESAMLSIRKWFSYYFKRGTYAEMPSLSWKVIDNKLEISVKPDENKKIKSVILYYSYGELNPAYRNWIAVEMHKDKFYNASFDIYNDKVRHFMFAKVIYSDNLEVSTLENTFIPIEQGLTSELDVNQRIIYDTSRGIDSFTVESNNLVIEDDLPFIEKSPMGIKGIVTKEGSLMTYKIGDIRCYGEDDSILQLDAYSSEDKDIEVVLTCEEEGIFIDYTTVCAVKGDDEWQKLSFAPQDFKTSELIPKKDWQNVKRLKLSATNVLFNNILWV